MMSAGGVASDGLGARDRVESGHAPVCSEERDGPRKGCSLSPIWEEEGEGEAHAEPGPPFALAVPFAEVEEVAGAEAAAAGVPEVSAVAVRVVEEAPAAVEVAGEASGGVGRAGDGAGSRLAVMAAGGAASLAVGAEDLIPLVVYVIVRARLHGVASELRFLATFVDDDGAPPPAPRATLAPAAPAAPPPPVHVPARWHAFKCCKCPRGGMR